LESAFLYLTQPARSSLVLSTATDLLGKTFFPSLIAGPFEQGLRIAFLISVVLALLAVLASLMRGQRYIYEPEHLQPEAGVQLTSEPHPASATRLPPA
jgi:hypothetical protein